MLVAAGATTVLGQVTSRASVDSAGTQANGRSALPAISADGRYVAFSAYASNLVPGDTNAEVFVRDRQLGTTERVSVSSGGADGDGPSNVYPASITPDGRYVAFSSYASNLVAGDTNGLPDVFVRDRQLGTTERVSVNSGGAQGNGFSGYGVSALSDDGRYVAFFSTSNNLVPGDTNATLDVFVRDRSSATTERVSVSSGGAQGNDASGDFALSISADGRLVVFESFASNLVPGDTNLSMDVFIHDRQLGTTERVSVDSAGLEGNNGGDGPSITANGRYVSFRSSSTNLVPGDTNGRDDIFVRDRQLGATERVSVDTSGAQGDGYSFPIPMMSADGRFITFSSDSTNLVPMDTNFADDVFVRDRDATAFTSLCDPGVDGVLACPCTNPPGGSGRGCDNSAATGGAILAASGVAYLSMDSLVFTTSGETPTAMSTLLQGASLAASGLVYGQGVRCAGGPLRKLFSKAASGGSITAPDFGAGDPTVSGTSAATGDVIQPGQSRWYVVFYRDPAGCLQTSYLGSAMRGFNATQTGRVDWSL